MNLTPKPRAGYHPAKAARPAETGNPCEPTVTSMDSRTLLMVHMGFYIRTTFWALL